MRIPKVLFCLFVLSLSGCFSGARLPVSEPETEVAVVNRSLAPLTDDERAALCFLAYISAPMSGAEEKNWWNFGGRQKGLFAKRYNIAFLGYAAAALGQRGTDSERRRVATILDHCIVRYLSRDVWAYTQTSDYWLDQPWSPDPCYRENVMYTGHLLQLLALYETFSHDTKYWTQGFDFVWNNEKRVHYTVKKLIDVTVDQMRTNDFHGVTCEPGLLFFPCNNHPHYALKLFAKLGHGDWTEDARRWEKWAVDHFLSPLFGGGAINLFYHAKTGLFYPRGSAGLDGWSLLWYEPWAEKRETSLKLWKKAAEKIDWDDMDGASDAPRKEGGCCDPLAVPHSVSAVFLAAAARANDDPTTAARLERAVDAYLVRKNGFYYLDLNREWRIGATAHRIIALALANGSRFLNL